MPLRPALLLTVLLVAVVLPTGPAVADESLSYRDVVDMTFPLPPSAVWEPSPFDWANADSISHYDAARGTRDGKPRKHQSIDLMVPYGTPVYAAMSGTITWMPDGASYGYMIRVAGDDGRIYDYIHLGHDDRPASEAYADGLAKGSYVQRGQLLGWAGCSGSASCTSTGYHLHFSVEDPSITDDPYFNDPDYYHYKNPRLDPFLSLKAALQRGDIGTGAGSFVDVAFGSTHFNDIERIAESGLTEGCGVARFCPKDAVTRGQMAAFLVRALKLTETSDGGVFSDVPSGSTFATAINRLGTAGITKGCNPPANDRFCPDTPVTRAQMASFLVRAKELSPADGPSFSDVDAQNVHRHDIAALAAAGITKGCGPDQFCPDDSVTRQQMASFLVRAFLND